MPNQGRNRQLQELARRGAEARLAELRQEIHHLSKLFPGLSRTARVDTQAAGTAARRTPTWSAAARKAAATRMKAYWAKRRKAR